MHFLIPIKPLKAFGRNGCGWSLGKMSLADSRVICERPTWVLINKKRDPKNGAIKIDSKKKFDHPN